MFWFLFCTSVLFSIGCPPIKFTEFQSRNFTSVEGYNITTLKFSFDGDTRLLKMWILLPHSQTPVLLKDQYGWENHSSCIDDTKLFICCKFEFIIHSLTSLQSGTAFSYTGNFTDEDTAWISK